MSHVDVQVAAGRLLDELERAIVGKRQVLELIVTALLADGHILLEDVPGVAKTAIARALAEAAGLQFARVQFTPDLIPADITGATVLAGASGEPTFQPGPVFANLVLGDEINRAPPKTQSALLEAMEERQVTADAVTRPLPEPFLVIGTQNPIEQEGTYPLPEAQLDRFLIRTGVGYPGRDHEVELLMRRAERAGDRMTLNPVLSRDDVVGLQMRVEQVHVSRPVAQYVVDLVEATRTSPRTEAGASPRGSLALLKAGRARAAMAGRSHVLPDDIKAVAEPCLAHRLILQPDQWVRGVRTEQVVREIVGQVPAPQSVEPFDQSPSRFAAPATQTAQVPPTPPNPPTPPTPPTQAPAQQPGQAQQPSQVRFSEFEPSANQTVDHNMTWQQTSSPPAAPPRNVVPQGTHGRPAANQPKPGGGFVPGEQSWGQGFDAQPQSFLNRDELNNDERNGGELNRHDPEHRSATNDAPDTTEASPLIAPRGERATPRRTGPPEPPRVP